MILTDAPGFASQDQHGGLEGVLGLVMVMQNSPAQAPNHRPMPPQK
jgi:hypothetical protein